LLFRGLSSFRPLLAWLVLVSTLPVLPVAHRASVILLSVYRGLQKSRAPSVFCKRIVRIAVQPVFPRFRGRDDGMMRRSGVLGGVPIRRRIAAERGATRLACPQVHPSGVNLDAFLAHMAFRGNQLDNAADVTARILSHVPSRAPGQ